MAELYEKYNTTHEDIEMIDQATKPLDPGDMAPPAGAYITISNESGTDSDCSLISKRKVKRSHIRGLVEKNPKRQ
ncbi:hypothetical protein RR48_10412 [Papilio machaon]|uniref:Uncharacterized protein n=1 Tax=Papilio machaon TaxID=76193 RepID=A0A194R524_PAPMA|nr:hypothetical protein RR48_10412 [Papilio machaon]